MHGLLKRPGFWLQRHNVVIRNKTPTALISSGLTPSAQDSNPG